MKYLINLFKTINTNVGDSILVYIGNDLKEYESKIIELEKFFRANGTLIKTSEYVHEDEQRTEAYIEFSLIKENK